MTDLEIAVALEVQLAGTLVPADGCGCPLRVLGRHESRPWYKVRLCGLHELQKIRAPLPKMREGRAPVGDLIRTSEPVYGWFTLSGKRVPDQFVRMVEQLRRLTEEPDGT